MRGQARSQAGENITVLTSSFVFSLYAGGTETAKGCRVEPPAMSAAGDYLDLDIEFCVPPRSFYGAREADIEVRRG